MPKQWLIIVGILFVAFFFRFNQLREIPPGLYPDEAMNGNNALEALATDDFKVFYPENNGREGLFITIQALFVQQFGNEPWVLRSVSAIFGILTVLGLYLLTRTLFNWQIAALSSFLLSISFWHVLFSRIGFRAIMAPFVFVWASYFIWQGLRSSRLASFLVGGVFLGLGFHTYIGYRLMPLVVVLGLLAYWYAIKKDFADQRYHEIRHMLSRGFAAILLGAILAAAPILYYFYTNPSDFFGRAGQVSVFSSERPLAAIAENTLKTFGMFNFQGDFNWRHNVSGLPMLIWPVGVLFLLGLIRAFIKLFRSYRSHGHLSSTYVFLLAWFFIALVPAILSNEGIPHALRAIQVLPVIYIFAGEGLWWLYELIKQWYRVRDKHEVSLPHHMHTPESHLVGILVVLIFLTSITVVEYDKYFNKWAKNANVAQAFNSRYVEIGRVLEDMPRTVRKFVVVNAPGVLVRNIPMPAQTVMFVTDTYTEDKQKAKNIYYLTEAQFKKTRFRQSDVIIKLEE